MEQRSLRVVDSNKTFFGRLSSTLSRIMIPTKIGINGFVINLKRNNLLKTYETANKADLDEEKKKTLNSKYQEAYSLYLEAIDKYIMDSVYKKVKTNTATEFEKEAMGNYYKITTLKEKEYIEYKYRKQKYLIELDYESLKLNSKEKTIKKYQQFYLAQMDNFYKGILKNYSVKLADTKTKEDINVFDNIFSTLEEYVERILPLRLEENKNNLEEKIGTDLQRLEQFEIGKLDEKDIVEKNMLLLNISRQIFTHSLPLVAAEKCYEKLLQDIRKIIVNIKGEKQRLESYNLLLDLLETYNIKLLSTKVYWERLDKREEYKKFLDEYQKTESSKEKEILFIKREINILEKTNENDEILKFYKNRLISYGVMKTIKNTYRTSNKYTKNNRKVVK